MATLSNVFISRNRSKSCTTSPCTCAHGFSLSYSAFIRITHGIALLSSPAGTKIFQFPACACATIHGAIGYLGFSVCMQLPQAYRSLPRPLTLLEPSHPLGGLKFKFSSSLLLKSIAKFAISQVFTASRSSSRSLYFHRAEALKHSVL